jgi:hypothetical protein
MEKIAKLTKIELYICVVNNYFRDGFRRTFDRFMQG